MSDLPVTEWPGPGPGLRRAVACRGRGRCGLEAIMNYRVTVHRGTSLSRLPLRQSITVTASNTPRPAVTEDRASLEVFTGKPEFG